MTTTTQPVPQSGDGICALTRWSKKPAFRSHKTKAEIKVPSLMWSKSNYKRYCHNLSLYLITYFLINLIHLVPEWIILQWKRKRYLKLWERWNANWWSIQMWELDHKELMFLNCDAGELFRVPWTARRSNQSILKEINPEYSLEGLMLKLKLQYFRHLMRGTDSLEKILMLGKTEGKRRRGDRKWDGWMASLTPWTWLSANCRR